MTLLEILIVILVVFWLAGTLALPVSGVAVDVLLAVVALLILIRLLEGRL